MSESAATETVAREQDLSIAQFGEQLVKAAGAMLGSPA